ncbi:MAG: CvpA family protein [Dehalococcoidia bacterium]|nr:CvpA family protein [Dehalococcoidia bacterium]
MNWIDLLIVAVIAWTAFNGFRTGLIRQVVWLTAIVVGIVLAGLLYDDLAANLDFVIEDSTTRNLVAFAAIVLGAVVAGAVIGTVLKTTASLFMLGPLDSLGGAAVGLVRGVLYVQAALFVLAVYPASEGVGRGIADSSIAAYFLDDVGIISVVLPDQFRDPLDQLESWRDTLASFIPDLQDAATSAETPSE